MTTKEILVCTHCGSPRLFQDAEYVVFKDYYECYDHFTCADCNGECHTEIVTVPSTFNVDTDFYKKEES